MQSSIFMNPSAFAPTVAIASSSVQIGLTIPTIPLNVLTRQETKEAFSEVSSAFQDMFAKHRQIQGGL